MRNQPSVVPQKHPCEPIWSPYENHDPSGRQAEITVVALTGTDEYEERGSASDQEQAKGGKRVDKVLADGSFQA